MAGTAHSALIRPATESDLEAVAGIYGFHVQHGTASFETEAPALGEVAKRYRDVTRLGLPYRVAEMDSRVVGFAYAGPYRPRPAYRFTVEDSVYLDAGFAGRGIGRRLLNSILEASAAAGAKQMVAIIGDSGNTASIRLHEAAGFAHVGVLRGVGFKFGRWLDTVIMQKPLSD